MRKQKYNVMYNTVLIFYFILHSYNASIFYFAKQYELTAGERLLSALKLKCVCIQITLSEKEREGNSLDKKKMHF